MDLIVWFFCAVSCNTSHAGTPLMDKVFTNQEAHSYTLEANGTLDLLHCTCHLLVLSSTGQSQYPLQLANRHWPIGADMKHGGSCSEKGLIDMQTNRSKRKFAEIQQEVLHDTTAGSMPHALHIFGASPTGDFSVLSCSSVRQQMQASCKFQT